MIRKKVTSYENFLSSNIEDLISQSQDPSVFDIENTTQNSISPMITKANSLMKHSNIQHKKSNLSINPSQNQLYASVLDFNKAKKTLIYEKSEPLICALLQALRWRITRYS